MKNLAIRRVPENMTKEQAQDISREMEHNNRFDVQVKRVPDLNSLCFVMKSDFSTSELMRKTVNNLIESKQRGGKQKNDQRS